MGAAVASVAGARPAGAQGAVGGGRTMTLLPSMAQVGPCDATAPTRDAATAEGRRRMQATEREVVRREMAGQTPSGETPRPTRVLLRRPSGWLGVNTVDVSDLRMTREGRVVRYCAYPVVITVEPGSPAEKGGLASGDTIVAYAGRDLLKGGEIELDKLLIPGQTLRVTVRRDGRTLVKPVVVGQRPTYTFFRSIPVEGEVRVYTERTAGGRTVVTERIGGAERVEVRAPRPPRVYGSTTPAPAPAAPVAPTPPATPVAYGEAPTPAPALPPVPYVIGYGGPSVVVGAQVVAADDDLREALRADARGVLVIKVLPGTPAAHAGLRGGDVIVRANGMEVLTPTALHRMVLRMHEARTLVLRVDRRGQDKDVTLRW
jgi:serine protease Do